MRLSVLFFRVVTLAVSISACGTAKEESTGSDGGRARAIVSNPPAGPSSQAALDPLAVVERGGELFFVLDESREALEEVERQCRATKDPVACVERIREGGSRESLRLGKTAEGLQLESVGHHDEQEEIYTRLGFSARRGPGSRVLCTATTAITGTRVARSDHWRSFTLAVLDEDTLALESEAHGPMVYRRR